MWLDPMRNDLDCGSHMGPSNFQSTGQAVLVVMTTRPTWF